MEKHVLVPKVFEYRADWLFLSAKNPFIGWENVKRNHREKGGEELASIHRVPQLDQEQVADKCQVADVGQQNVGYRFSEERENNRSASCIHGGLLHGLQKHWRQVFAEVLPRHAYFQLKLIRDSHALLGSKSCTVIEANNKSVSE